MSADGFPLPPELFVLACRHLPTSDLIALSHVCAKWRRTLLSTPRLWSTLDGLDLNKPRVLEHAAACLGRAGGQLCSLRVGLPDSAERLVEYFVAGRSPRTIVSDSFSRTKEV